MKPIVRFPVFDRRILLSSLAMMPALSVSLRYTAAMAQAQRDPLPSWNDKSLCRAVRHSQFITSALMADTFPTSSVNWGGSIGTCQICWQKTRGLMRQFPRKNSR